jgi:hypothetical protein
LAITTVLTRRYDPCRRLYDGYRSTAIAVLANLRFMEG